ncbi:MAG: hypothetical protein ACI9JL_000160 [Paracoccaceae bacterium]|jgi:hypothetical protein
MNHQDAKNTKATKQIPAFVGMILSVHGGLLRELSVLRALVFILPERQVEA